MSVSFPDGLVEAILSCLLHDIGKPVQRAALGYRGTHSAIGRAFLKKVWLHDARNPSEFADEAGEADVSAADQRILDAISYHHGAALRAATEHGRLSLDAPAYIAYIADNIAAGTDRRKADSDHEGSIWDSDTPLASVFDQLGDVGSQKHWFRPELLDDREPINNPTDKSIAFDKHRYTEIILKLEQVLAGVERTPEYLSSLLNVLEASLSFVPSSTDVAEVPDISLFDHLKLTASFGACIWHYLAEKGETNYRSVLFENQESFYDEEAFLLASFDLSGIQDFIYTIHSDGAAKMLRSRSFYLELLTEHIADTILERLQLSRANLNYSGGGHAYFILPNTAKTRAVLADIETEVNGFFLSQFGPRLFFALGYTPFNARLLMRPNNTGSGSNLVDSDKHRAAAYAALYQKVSEQISAKKLARYGADALRLLNNRHHGGITGDRECRVCHTVSTNINANGLCALCDSLSAVSNKIQAPDFRYAIIEPELAGGGQAGGLPLPFADSLRFVTSKEAANAISANEAVRVYAKNKFVVGEAQGTRLWIGDYSAAGTFSDYVKGAAGIKRLGVLRLDVDNLGSAFVSGFSAQKDGRYNTLSRTASFSRMLSLFFRQHINYLLKYPKYFPLGGGTIGAEREATIIYSGGDDVFVVGAWDDVLEFALELQVAFEKYTQGKLTVSAGIGIFPDKYPIQSMAQVVGELESAAKTHPGKNAVAVFNSEMVFSWPELRNQVIGEKYAAVEQYFAGNTEKGASFIYQLLSLLDQRGKDRITQARWVYFLSRTRDLHSGQGKAADAAFKEFTDQMYRWFQSDHDARQLRLALELYVYRNRT